jgi:hypothetical protein
VNNRRFHEPRSNWSEDTPDVYDAIAPNLTSTAYQRTINDIPNYLYPIMMTRQLDKKAQKSGTNLFASFNIYILGRVFRFDSYYADSEANRAKNKAIIADEIKQAEGYVSLTQFRPYEANVRLKLDAKKSKSENVTR